MSVQIATFKCAPLPGRVTVMRGRAQVSDDPAVEFTTLLGSCIAVCLFDPFARQGGMNHFLLGEPPKSMESRQIDEHYGTYLMEVLLNAMYSSGSTKSRLRAHVYGGANMTPGMERIGTMNAEFARAFLTREHIPLVHEETGGSNARRVDFRPALGKARCCAVSPDPITTAWQPPSPRRTGGDVELF